MNTYCTALRTMMLAALTLAAVVLGVTHDAPRGGWSADSAVQSANDTKPVNVPTWRAQYADRFPGCQAALPAGVVPSAVVAVQQNGTVVQVPVQAAWVANRDDTRHNDTWIVGQCR